jgi:hypothetical protein
MLVIDGKGEGVGMEVGMDRCVLSRKCKGDIGVEVIEFVGG